MTPIPSGVKALSNQGVLHMSHQPLKLPIPVPTSDVGGILTYGSQEVKRMR